MSNSIISKPAVGEKKLPKHSICISDGYIKITGVGGVDALSEKQVILKLEDKRLQLDGSELFADNVNMETGDVTLKGKINSLKYLNSSLSSLAKKLFK